MSIPSIDAANGAQLLSLLAPSTGQAQSTTPEDAVIKAMKTAIAEAQISESEILGSGSGNLLSVYA